MRDIDSRRPVGGLHELVKAVEFFAPDVRVHKLFNPSLDSTNIGPAEWKLILSIVTTLCNERIEWIKMNSGTGRQAVPGIVITHGTDTLQETALLLALELAGFDIAFPIILTCSYAPATEPQSDALRNLVLAAAASLSFRLSRNNFHQIPPGVYVVVGSDLHLASRIKKVTTMPLNARSYVESFPAPSGQLTIAHKANLWHLDIENEVRLRLHRELCPPKRSNLLRDSGRNEDFGYVEHLWFKKDSPLEILKSALRRCYSQAAQSNRSALVLQGDFSNKPVEELQAVVDLLRRFRPRGREQVPVFSGSPAVVAKVHSIAKRRNILFLIPKSLSHAKARTKLSWLLKKPLNPATLACELCHDIAGECFEVPVLPDWIAGESYGPNNHLDKRVAKRVVIVFPGIELDVYTEAIKSLVKATAKKKELNIVGFGDGNIPLGPMTVAETVSDYMRDRYGLDCEFGASVTYQKVEMELASFLRYNSQFRMIIAEKYEFKDKNEMVREILGWCANEQRKAEHAPLRHHVEVLFTLLAEELGINEKGARHVIESSRISTQALLSTLKNPERQKPALQNVQGILAQHGFSTVGLPSLKSDIDIDLGAFWAPHLMNWVTAVEQNGQQRSLLVKELAIIYARRIMKDALAARHILLKEIVWCVDLGIRVNIRSNVEMIRTDTRRYELGNFLLIAGAHSGKHVGWHAGPLRLKPAKKLDSIQSLEVEP